MERETMIQSFMMTKSKFFASEDLPMIRSSLEAMTDQQLMLVSSLDYKDPTLILVVSIVGGTLGIDRFLVGDIGLGVLKLLTVGVCGIYTIIDWFLIGGRTRKLNFEKFMRAY